MVTGRRGAGFPDHPPPHVWGRRRPRVDHPAFVRITPTRVGTTHRSHVPCTKITSLVRRSGITPTRVGTTADQSTAGPTWRDHPHVRGDNAPGSPVPGASSGSPPRAWGQPRNRRDRATRGRITPTCVGTTAPRTPCRSARWDHPHVRGDNNARSASRRSRSGSPPRAWGQRPLPSWCGRSTWITPTCVGTTPVWPRSRVQRADHPHVRGDNHELGITNCTVEGSPPRAWGQHFLTWDVTRLIADFPGRCRHRVLN